MSYPYSSSPGVPELNRMMDAMQMGWWVADFEKGVNTLSESFANYLGVGSNQMPFGDFIGFIRPDYRNAVAEAFASIVVSDIFDRIFPIAAANGELWVHSRMTEKHTGPGGSVVARGVMQIVQGEGHGSRPRASRHFDHIIEKQNDIYTSLLSFLGSDNISQAVETTLSDILDQFDGNNIAIFEYDHARQTQRCTYNVSKGETPARNMGDIPISGTPWWNGRMLSRLPVIAGNLNVLPREARVEKDIFNRYGISSVMGAPLVGRDRIWGYIAMDSAVTREWSDEDYHHFNAITALVGLCLQFHASEEEIRRNQQHIRGLHKNMPVGIEIYDKDGYLTDMNDKECEIFGLAAKEDALGVNMFDNPNIPDAVKEKLRRHEQVEFRLNYDFSKVGEYYETNKDKKIYLVTIATPMFDSQGEFTNYMFINIDNTDTVTAHRRIEDFEEMTSLIGRFAQVGYASFDLYTRQGQAIDSWFVNLGEKPGTPMDQVVGVLNNVVAEDKAPIKEFFAKVKRGEATHLRHDIRVVLPDGRHNWTRLNVMVRSFNPGENKIGMVCVNYDITALKQTEMNLIEARDKAEASDRLKSAFLANMSHEIRTPLNAIVGFSSLLADTEDPEQRRQYRSIVHENNEMLLKLISDILDISKIETGTMDFLQGKVDVYQLCREIINTFKAPEGVELRFDDSLPEIFVTGDKNRITQVLFNFMTNALKFTKQGSITLAYAKQEDGMLKFCVTDTGIGIAPEKQDSVFDRFVKLDTFMQGTGLGLSICHSLVEKMGGQIGVESMEGKGSCFWFTHPYA